MLSSRLSGYNRVWSCPACRALIITEAPDKKLMEKEIERGLGGGRERRREGKAKLRRTQLKEGWRDSNSTE